MSALIELRMLREQCRKFEVEIEDLKAEIAWLKNSERLKVWEDCIPFEWDLRPQARRLLALFLEKGRFTRMQAVHFMYNIDNHEPPITAQNCVSVGIYRLRQILAPLGITIHSRPMVGYWLTEEDYSRLREHVGRKVQRVSA